MIPDAAAAALVLGAVLLPLMILTANGERRRGHGLLIAIAAGLFFPITWGAWYLRDEHPYHASDRT